MALVLVLVRVRSVVRLSGGTDNIAEFKFFTDDSAQWIHLLTMFGDLKPTVIVPEMEVATEEHADKDVRAITLYFDPQKLCDPKTLEEIEARLTKLAPQHTEEV